MIALLRPEMSQIRDGVSVRRVKDLHHVMTGTGGETSVRQVEEMSHVTGGVVVLTTAMLGGVVPRLVMTGRLVEAQVGVVGAAAVVEMTGEGTTGTAEIATRTERHVITTIGTETWTVDIQGTVTFRGTVTLTVSPEIETLTAVIGTQTGIEPVTETMIDHHPGIVILTEASETVTLIDETGNLTDQEIGTLTVTAVAGKGTGIETLTVQDYGIDPHGILIVHVTATIILRAIHPTGHLVSSLTTEDVMIVGSGIEIETGAQKNVVHQPAMIGDPEVCQTIELKIEQSNKLFNAVISHGIFVVNSFHIMPNRSGVLAILIDPNDFLAHNFCLSCILCFWLFFCRHLLSVSSNTV